MALPFGLPAVSRGHAELTSASRRLGAAVAEAAARALSDLVGAEVSVNGRPVPGRAWPRPAAARIAVDLPALPGTAILEVEPALVVRLVDRMAGGDGAPALAAALTPVEATALELLALAALDGACAAEAVEERLAPRLARAAPEPAGALAIELEVAAGPARGRARLLLPPAAVRALRGPAELDRPIPVPGSLRRGSAALTAAELDALEPGDVLVVDPPADGRDALVLPGGLRALGRIDGEGFHVEETEMVERHAQLPVTLEVELARVDVPLAEVARLEPGSVLALNLDRRGLVALRMGERAVARGELVDVEGAVGVRILSLEVAP